MVIEVIILCLLTITMYKCFLRQNRKIEIIVKSSLCSRLLIKSHIYIHITTYPLSVTINTKYHNKS